MTKRTTRKAAEAAGTVVYCGPSIKGVAKQFTRLQQRDPGGAESGDREKQGPGRPDRPLETCGGHAQLRQKSGRLHTLYKAVQGRT